MIAQAVLSLLLCSVLVYSWAEQRRSPIVAAMSGTAALAGLYFVWFPAHSTRVAELVGIGRGADLILYMWVCISLIILLNLHLKLRTQHELITALARTIALANAGSQSEESRIDTGPTPLTPVMGETDEPGRRPASVDGHKSKRTSDQTV
jgi:small membrane protein